MAKRAVPGFYGWKLMFVLWLIHVLVVGFGFFGPPLLFPLMIKALGWSRTEISLGFMLAILLMGFSAPLAAWSVFKLGGRLTLSIGILVSAIGMFFIQFADTVPVYIALFGLFVGPGWAFGAMIPVQTLMTLWFNKKRGAAFGLVWTGGAVGGLISPTVLNLIIEASDGRWQVGWITLAIVMLAASIIAGVFVRNSPEDMGQYPDGIAPDGALANVKSAAPAQLNRPALNLPLRDILGAPQFWLLTLTFVSNMFAWQMILTQGPLHLSDRGFSVGQYSLIYGITVAITIIGSTTAGYLADRLQPRLMLRTACGFALAGSILFWFVSPDRLPTLIYPLFSGIAIGAMSILPPLVIGRFWGAMAFARVNGVMLPISTVFNSTASPIAGAAYDHSGSYFYALALSWTLLAVAMLAMGRLDVSSGENPAMS